MEPTTSEESTRESSQTTSDDEVNGIDTHALFETIDTIKGDPALASCKFFAATKWNGGTTSDCTISRYQLSGEDIPEDFTMSIDEPIALLGTDAAPNPQMYLFAALASCVLNTFVINAAARKIRLDSLEIDVEGELDLRGFLGIDESVNAGYNELTLVCRVTGDGTREQYEQCLEAGTRYSPNFQSISRPVAIHYRVEM